MGAQQPSKLAVVTGASSGIGAATAVRFAREGFTVALVARRKQALQAVSKAVLAHGGQAQVYPIDASDEASVMTMAEQVLRSGVPSAIVNCAGAGVWRFVEETPAGAAETMIKAPYLAAFHFCRAFIPAMLEQQSGVVMHVGSPASRIPVPGAAGYVAARWALRGLHEALRMDLRGTGVQSCHVVFGKVASSYFEANPDSEQRIPSIMKWVPLLSPEQCADFLWKIYCRPRPEALSPSRLRWFYAVEHIAPNLTRAIAARTGYRRVSTTSC